MTLLECFESGRKLAAIAKPPAASRYHRWWWNEEVTEVRLNHMFARVAVLRSERHRTSLYVNGRDRKVKRLRAGLVGTTLELSGAPLFENKKNHIINPFNCLEVILLIPGTTILTVGDIAGSIGVVSGLETIKLHTQYPLDFYTPRAKLVTGTFGGEGMVTVDQFDDPNSHIEVTGPGKVQLGRQAALTS